MKELGRRVKARRTKLSLTQAALSAKVGRKHPWLSALEHGKAGEVPAEILTALAIELGEDPMEYLRLAGRAVLRAEDVVPAPAIDPRIATAIDQAVGRAMDRLADRLVEFLDQRLPRSDGGGAA